MWHKIDGTQAGYNAWRANFGRTLGGGSLIAPPESPANVPEPASVALLLIGMALVLCRPRVSAMHASPFTVAKKRTGANSKPTTSLRVSSFLGCLIVFLAATEVTRAATFIWTNSSGNGQFGDAQNWNPFPGGPPDDGDIAAFLTTGGSVSAANGTIIDDLVVYDTDVALSLLPFGVMDFRAIGVGIADGNIGSLSIQNGVYDASDQTIVGLQSGSSGSLTVMSAASLESGDVLLGGLAGSQGELHVDGGFVGVIGDLLIGDGGSASMTVSNGGIVSSLFQVSNRSDVIGTDPGSMGVVTVTGTGSFWVAEVLDVGLLGHGTLNIQDGGTVECKLGYIGINPGSMGGTVTISGTGSTWKMDFLLGLGTGSVTMSGNGARIYVGEDAESISGNLPLTESAIVVSGQRPNTDPLRAVLAVYDGSTISGATNFYAGVESGDYAQLVVDGTGSTINVEARFILAGDSEGPSGATAELTVHNVGVVNIGSELQVHPGGSLTLLTNGSVNVGSGMGSAGRINVLQSGTLGGAGMIHGTVQNSAGTVTPGASTGILSINGNYQQGQSGVLEIEIGGTAAGTQYDRLAITGAANLNGSVAITLVDLGIGFVPSLGNTFDILTATGGVNGMFSVESFPSIGSGLEWEILYDTDSVMLSVIAASLPGDFNGDGTVDTADFVMWRKNGGTQEEYNTWRANFGRTLGGGGSSAITSEKLARVPEPGGEWLVLIAAMVIVGIRRAKVAHGCVQTWA